MAGIKEKRMSHGLTVERLAEMVDISARELHSIENGKHVPRLERAYNIFMILTDKNDGSVCYSWNPLTLSNARESRNMTQDELAKMIGVSRRSVNRWESILNPTQPSMRQFYNLIKLFGMKIEDFFVLKGRRVEAAI